jgi:lysophospholipase L1-like esterase
MLKFKGAAIVLLFLALLSTGLFVRAADTPNSSPWLSNPSLSLQKVADVAPSDVPSTFFNAGNIDCSMGDDGHCAISTTYGNVYNGSLWTGTKWTPIKDAGGNSANYFAIPNSSIGLTSSFGPVFGNYLYLTDDIYSSLTPKYKTGVGGTTINGINNLILDHYQLNHTPDRRVQDLAGNRLAADLNSLAASGDSRWMVFTDPNIANVRVNITNGTVLPFGVPFAYGTGGNPVPKNAISSDGRYAVTAAEDSVTFRIYDLSTCDAVPQTITRAVNCQSRDLLNTGFINSQIPGFIGVRYIRFLDDNSISFYASYKDGSETKYAQYLLSTNDLPANQQQYLALGDSYISGEGTFKYIPGTDTGTNTCHVSLLSYPYLIGHDLNYDSYHSVACSGATTDDIINTSPTYVGQADKSDGISRILLDGNGLSTGYLTNFTPGYINQLDFVKTYRPQVVTVSIGGNDMGFSDILKQCVTPIPTKLTCYSTYEDRQELVNLINNTVFPNLVKTYAAIKKASPTGTRIYTIGYPQIAMAGGDCGVNVALNDDEVLFSQQIINYLDGVIARAAAKSGVYYVNTQNAFDGHRLCEAGPGDGVAVNGLTAGNDRPKQIGGPLGDESYHPTVFGHQLLEASILSKTDKLTVPMPLPNPSASPADVDSSDILNVPHSGRQVNTTQYDPGMSADLAYRGTPINVNITGSNHLISSGTTFKAELHSDPINLGSFQTGAGGNITTNVLIPGEAPTGYHVLHFYGQDVNGQPIDIYKYIYIANTADDMDGDGVIDSAQACVEVSASDQDYDKDGIDDACDGEITEPQVAPETNTVTSGPVSTGKINSPPSLTKSNDPRTPQIQASVVSPQDENAATGSIVQPKVLAAETKNLPTSSGIYSTEPQSTSTSFYAIGGAGAITLSMLGFIVKRWLA